MASRRRSTREPYKWLGTFAVGVGLCISAGTNTGFAHADDASSSAPSVDQRGADAGMTKRPHSAPGATTKNKKRREETTRAEGKPSGGAPAAASVAGVTSGRSTKPASPRIPAMVRTALPPLHTKQDPEAVGTGTPAPMNSPVAQSHSFGVVAQPAATNVPVPLVATMALSSSLDRVPAAPEVPLAGLLISAAGAVRREVETTYRAITYIGKAVAKAEPSAALVPLTAVAPAVNTTVSVGAYFPEAVAVSPNGRYAYAGNTTMNMAAGSVTVIDTTTKAVKATVPISFAVTGVDVAPNGRIYATGFRAVGGTSASAMVSVIDPATNKVTKTITLGGTTSYSLPVEVAPDGKSVVVGYSTPVSYGVGHVGTLAMISTATQTVTKRIYFDGSVADFAISPDSQTAYVALVDHYPATLLKVNLASTAGTAIDLDAYASEVRSVVLSPDGSQAYVAIDGYHDVAVVNTATGAVTATFDAGQASSAEHLALTPDGKYLVATENDTVYVVDTAGRQSVSTLNVGTGPHYYLSGVAVSPSSGRVFTANLYDSSIGIINLYPANAAPDATVSVGSPNAKTGVVTGTVTASDPNGNPVTFAVGAPGDGAVTMTTGGAFKYTPNASARHAASADNASASDKVDTFTVTVANGAGGSLTLTVTVPVAPKNVAPKAKVTVAGPEADGAVKGTIVGTDADNDELSFAGPSATTKGAVSVRPDGTFTYTPTQAARLAAGAKNAPSAVKTDSFTVTMTDGHGGTVTVPVSVKIAPITVKPTATGWFNNMDPDTANKITVQLVRSKTDGKTRMVVSMTGIANFSDGGTAVRGNLGELNPKVSAFIDNAYDSWSAQGLAPSEIMLVGFSNGGQQMQNYAALGQHKELVKTVLLFGAPLTKKLNEIGVNTGSTKSALLIADLGDQTWAYGTRILADHTDAEDSYDATNTDRGTIYWAGQPTTSDTHGQATYRSAADEFDKMIARKLSTPYFADFRRPYDDWQRFGGTVFKTDSSIVSTF